MATPVKMMRLSKGMSAGTVLAWLKSPGEHVEAGEPLLNVLSEKVDVQVDAPASGILLDVVVPAGDEVPVGTVLGWIGQQGDILEPVAPTSRTDKPPTQSLDRSNIDRSVHFAKVKASPIARRMAAQHGIALATLAGSGPNGIITKSDVEQAMKVQSAVVQRAPGLTPSFESEEIERVPLQGIRQVMAERMALSKRTAADVTTVMDIDMGAIRSLKQHVPVGYTSAVVKATALALKQHRLLNASFDENEIVMHKRAHVGVAVDTPRGLTVVTVADAGEKTLREVDNELRQLSQGSKAGQLSPDAAVSPTFTVTNSGVFGTVMFTPIINPPQSAILGMGKVEDTPVVRDGQIVACPIMYLCLTYDHRIIEGAEAAEFLNMVKNFLEDPARMI